MPLIDTYRNNITKKKAELAKLSQDRSRESSKIAAQQQKITSAKKAAMSTKSLQTVKSKSNEIERAEKEISSIYKKIADYDAKIAKKEKEISDEEKKYHAEEVRETKKRAELEKKRLQESSRDMQKINNTLIQHSRTQNEIKQAIVDLQSIPEKITVLFLASNPDGTDSLKLDEEARTIKEMIRSAEYRDSVEFVTRWAVRASDVLTEINEVNPDVVHFSGHGTESDELILQNSDGSIKYVRKEAIASAISTVSDKVRLVFFNTCFSYGQAESIVEYIDSAIGMAARIGDVASRVFAARFYSSISFGKSLQISFNQAKAELLLEDIPEEDTPQLCLKDGIDANEVYIVRPL